MKKVYFAPESNIVDLSCGRIMQAAVEIGSGTVETSDFDAKAFDDGDIFDDMFNSDFYDEFNRFAEDFDNGSF